MREYARKTTQLDPKVLEDLLASKDSYDEVRTYGSTSNLIRFEDSPQEILNYLKNTQPKKREEWFNNFVKYAIERNNHAFLAKARRLHHELELHNKSVAIQKKFRERWEHILQSNKDQ